MFSFFSSFLISCLFRSQLSVCVCVFISRDCYISRSGAGHSARLYILIALFLSSPFSYLYTLFLIIYDTYEKLFGIIELHIDKLAAHV